MKISKQRNNHLNHNSVNKVDSKAVSNNVDRKDRPDIHSKNEKRETLDKDRKKKLEDELQEYRYSQSSKFSSVSRSLIFGIMGTEWAIILNSKTDYYHPFLTATLISCIIYLMIDLNHYYIDSKNYFSRQFELSKAETNLDLDHHDNIMDNLSRRSQIFVKWKYIILWFSVIMFLAGMIDSFYLSDLILRSIKEII